MSPQSIRRMEPLAFSSTLIPDGLAARKGKTTGGVLWSFMVEGWDVLEISLLPKPMVLAGRHQGFSIGMAGWDW